MGTSIQAGAPSYRLASLWPLRYRAEKDGLAPFSLQVSPNSKWYEGAGNLWVYVARDGRREYFDLSQNGALSVNLHHCPQGKLLKKHLDVGPIQGYAAQGGYSAPSDHSFLYADHRFLHCRSLQRGLSFPFPRVGQLA